MSYDVRTTHSITWDKAEVIEQENNKIRRKIKEALRIQNTDQCLNMDQGMQIDHIWRDIPYD